MLVWADEPREEPTVPATEEAAGGAYCMIAYMVPWGYDPACLVPIVTVVSLN